jgi:uncharacterized protein YcbK (DUF882 family)
MEGIKHETGQKLISRRHFITGTAWCLLNPAGALAGPWVNSLLEDHGDGDPLPEMVPPGGAEKVGPYCNGFLRLKSAIHGESYKFAFRDTDGNYDQQVLTALDWFLRCKDSTWQYMDVRAIESLNYLSKLLGDPVIKIISGYRSPQYNARLAAKQEGVARNSLHQYGRAIDFCIPGISVKDVCSYTLYARNALGFGGVGYYPRSGFVHLDSGTAREWAKG